VAQRHIPAAPTPIDAFERVVDQLFDDLLISRWRIRGREPAHERALIRDHGSHYEIRLQAIGADPDRMEVEVSERRLRVCIPGPAGTLNHDFDLAQAVDPAAVTARWLGDVLHLVLPKKPGRRIKVE
jgi:HSP20 family molecular chaperone IbpA